MEIFRCSCQVVHEPRLSLYSSMDNSAIKVDRIARAVLAATVGIFIIVVTPIEFVLPVAIISIALILAFLDTSEPCRDRTSFHRWEDPWCYRPIRSFPERQTFPFPRLLDCDPHVPVGRRAYPHPQALDHERHAKVGSRI